MIRHALFGLCAALALGFSTPASAQDALSEIPVAGAAAAKPPTAAPARSLYNSGAAPINLNSRGYVARETQQLSPTAQQTRPVAVNPTSATAYNQAIVDRRAKEQRRSNSVIPSPFTNDFDSGFISAPPVQNKTSTIGKPKTAVSLNSNSGKKKPLIASPFSASFGSGFTPPEKPAATTPAKKRTKS